ncbi:MAG: ion channel [Deltaproteobacteria bacterium]
MPNPDQKKPSIWSRLFDRMRKRRFSYLTKSLLLLILAYPYLEHDLAGQILMTVITIMVMMSLVVAVSDRKRYIIIALLFAIPWLVSLIINFPLIEEDRSVLIRRDIIFAVLLFLYTTYRIFMHLIRSREVTTEILFAAVCVYLLIGLSWTAIYILLDFLYPGSFVDIQGQAVSDAPLYLFFSYVSLTTVGYGNIIPATDHARSLAMIEAIMGQLYLTIMVARLVGLHISKSRATEEGV